MQAAANTSRFLTSCSSSVEFADSEIVVSRGGLLRHLVASHLARTVHSEELFIKLTSELIPFAEQAYFMRDLNTLDEVSQVLMNLPVDAVRQIGFYYHALAINRKGQRDEAEALFEKIADNGPTTYRARAIQTLGANCFDKGQPNETLRFQIEALRAASDWNAQGLQTTLLARWEISIIKSLDGDHEGALSDLNRLSPLVNLAAKQKPFYFYAYCNALAVGLGELGRIGEARAALDVALSSPYAPAYPEWSETHQELEAKRTSATSSIVAINRTPEAPPSPQAEPQRKPHRSTPRLSKWLASENTFLQRPSIPTAAITIIAGDQITQRILRRCEQKSK